MLELKVTLDFTCGSCEHLVSVTVTYSGDGLSSNQRPLATIQVPCPTCSCVNKVVFEPTGTVRKVTPHSGPLRYLEPSLN
jgi:hypothetical protein